MGSDSFNKKIRNAATSKTPNIFIVGEREQEQQEVTWRRYCVKEQQTLPLARALECLKQARSQRVMDNFADVEVLGLA